MNEDIPVLHTFAETYLNNLQSRVKNKSFEISHRGLNHFFSWAKGQSEFTEPELATYLMSLDHLKKSCQYDYAAILKAFFLWLHDNGKILQNPAKHLRVPKKNNP